MKFLRTRDDYDPDTILKRKLRSKLLFFSALVASAFFLSFLFSLKPEPLSTERLHSVGDFPQNHIWLNTRNPISLYDDLSGHIVILLFCEFRTLLDVRELSILENVMEQYSESPVGIILIYRSDSVDMDSLVITIENWGIELPAIVDTDGEVANNFVVRSYPTLLLLDANKRVSARYSTGWCDKDLESLVYDLLQQGVASRSLAHDKFEPEHGNFFPGNDNTR